MILVISVIMAAHQSQKQTDEIIAFIAECKAAGYNRDTDFDVTRADVQALSVKYRWLIEMSMSAGPLHNILFSVMWNACRKCERHIVLWQIKDAN